MKKNKTPFSTVLGDSANVRIIEFFIEGRELEHTKQDVIDDTKLSRATVYERWKFLEKKGVIIFSRKIGASKLYQLNTRDLVVIKLIEIFDTFLKINFVTKNSMLLYSCAYCEYNLFSKKKIQQHIHEKHRLTGWHL